MNKHDDRRGAEAAHGESPNGAAPGTAAWRYGLIIPALNEARSIGTLLGMIPKETFLEIIVVDNGSTDATAQTASDAGAKVIFEPRRGYGQACQAGIRALDPRVNAVVFMDADLSDDPSDLARLLSEFETSGQDLVIGSRVLGTAEPGALTPLQRFGNALATQLIWWIWKVRYTDLGPMRAIRRDALERLALSDRNFGWTVEMQAKAAKRGLRVADVPVSYRRRRTGQSKVSGTVKGSVKAGAKILLTIGKCWLRD